MACSARYSLKKPRPTLRATITAMITALVPLPVSPDTSAAAEQKDQDRVAELTEEDGRCTNPMRAQRVGTEPTKSDGRFVGGETLRTAPKARENFLR